MPPQSQEIAARESRTPKTWFVTGASRGLGRAFVEAALEAGDRVAATTRRAGRSTTSPRATARRSRS